MSELDNPAGASASERIADKVHQGGALGEDRALAEIAGRIFEFTQFLLDDDDNLTKVGNLNGDAKARLRARVLELMGAEADPPLSSSSSSDGAEPVQP